MNAIVEKIYEIGIVPVIAIDDAEKAVPLAKALVAGGAARCRSYLPHCCCGRGDPPHHGRSA